VRLILVRHAKAAPGDPDELRPLTAAGREAARALAQELAAHAPAAVVSSPLLRARETAEPIARAAGVEPATDERLAPGATAADVRALAEELGGETIVVVGHQPDCSQIVLDLAGREQSFAPGATAEVEL
jgi:phosphohistidine phosphatase